jgi:dTDP-4-amino-4,6-dideoxygalactose transaminase
LGTELLPVLRPKLPSAERIAKYLQIIDEARIYSNFGPLSREFERRVANKLHLEPQNFVAASCGTTALIGAILATAGVARKSRLFALIPSYTFAATAVAVERCGFQPYLADVDSDTWMLNPSKVLSHPQIDQIGLVVPVAPFGVPLPQANWIAFRECSGIPVVFDAAASFACICPSSSAPFIGSIPVALSFHATKSFGIGEGGGVISTDQNIINNIICALNFGFAGTRNSTTPSINGKISEFHAAVGLAALDCWDEKYAAIQQVARTYESKFDACGLGEQFIGSPRIDGNYALFMCYNAKAAANVEAALRQAAIDYRFWYGHGLHRHPHFSNSPRDELPVTKYLGGCLIGLPMAPDLPDDAIQRVVSVIHSAHPQGH